MCRTTLLIGLLLLVPAPGAQENDMPLSPAQARKQVDKQCTVEMAVRSTGKARTADVMFLNSETDYRSPDNFTIMLGSKAVQKYREDMIDPVSHFKGKTIHVTGKVKLYMGRFEIIVNDPGQVKVVEK